MEPNASAATSCANSPDRSRLALRTPLVQLPDLEHFSALLNRQLGLCRRGGSRLAVLMIAIDLPEELRPAVRQIAQEAAGARLANRVRSTDVVCRIGTLRFGVVLMGAGRKEAEVVRARLAKVIGGRYCVDSTSTELTLQVGLAVYRESGETGSELAQAALIDIGRPHLAVVAPPQTSNGG